VTPTEKALAEACGQVVLDRQRADFPERLKPYEQAIRADERAKLAASVAPMTMTAEREAEMRGSAVASYLPGAFAELDATRAALAVERERSAEMFTLLNCHHGHTLLMCSRCRSTSRAEFGRMYEAERERAEKAEAAAAMLPTPDEFRAAVDRLTEAERERDEARERLQDSLGDGDHAKDLADDLRSKLRDLDRVLGDDDGFGLDAHPCSYREACGVCIRCRISKARAAAKEALR